MQVCRKICVTHLSTKKKHFLSIQRKLLKLRLWLYRNPYALYEGTSTEKSPEQKKIKVQILSYCDKK